MKLAVNYSDMLISLISVNPNLPIDYIKAPTIPFPKCWDQFYRGKVYCNILPHLAQPGILFLSHPELDKNFNEYIIKKVLKLTKPPYLSTHIEAPLSHFPEFQKELHNRHPIINRVLKKRFLDCIWLVQRKIKIPLVLENSPYYSWYHYFKESCEPEFINELCEKGDCGFILDIAHARISAQNFKINVYEYIDALPLSKVIEIHLSGIREDTPIGFWDSHTMLDENDYTLLQYTLNKTKPEVVTIEYGGYPDYEPNPINGGYVDCLRNNLNELQEMITRVSTLIKCLK
jgi:uncharacterized protein (UPF0276 family)